MRLQSPRLQRLGLWAGFVVLALVLYARSIGTGFIGEDFMFLNFFEHPETYQRARGLWGQPIDNLPGFANLWWNEAGAKGAFFRPVTSLVLEAVHLVAGRQAVVYHLLSIVLHGSVAFLVIGLSTRLTGLPRLSVLAGLLFLVCEDHVLPVIWLSHITDLLCALLLAAGLIWHLRALQERRTLYGVAGFLALALAVLAKETGLVGLVGAVLATALRPYRATPAATSAIASRARALAAAWPGWLPHALAVLVYIAGYKLAGFGGANLAYHDPIAAPALFLRHLAAALPLSLGGMFSPLPIGLALFYPGLTGPFVAASLVVVAAVGAALWPHRNRPWVRFAALFLAAALLPQLSTDVSQRMYYVPMLTGALLIALLIAQVPWVRRRLDPEGPPPARVTGRVVGLAVGVMLGLLPLLQVPVMVPRYAKMMSTQRLAVEQTAALLGREDPQHLVYLNGPGLFFGPYPRDVYWFLTGRDRDFRVLTSHYGPTWCRITSDRRLVLRTVGERWLSSLFARTTRRTRHLAVGDRFATGLFTVRVERTTPGGQDLLEASFTFNRPLNDRGLALLYWDGARIRRLDPRATSQEWRLLGEARLGP